MSRKLVDGKLPQRPPGASKGGRPTELNDELQEKICQALKAGSFLETAVAFNKISQTSIRTWITTGRQNPESRHGEFLRAIEGAIAEGELRNVAAIDLAARGRPAEFAQDPMLDENNRPILVDGKPIMQLARDKDGNPIKIRDEIKPDVKAAQWMLAHRHHRKWGDVIKLVNGGDALLEAPASDFEKPNEKEVISQEELDRVKAKVTRLLLQENKFGNIEDA